MMITGSLQRIRLIAGNTLLEAVRQRMFALLLLVTTAFALGALALREFNFGASELKFTTDLGLGALSLFGSLLAIAGAVQTVFSEIEQHTIQLIFVRPVSRLEYVVGKLIGLQLMLGLFCLLILSVLEVVLLTRESALVPAAAAGQGASGGLFSTGGLVLAVAAQWLKCGVMTAAILLLCSIAQSRLYALGTGVILLIIFHAHPIVAGMSRSDSSSALKWSAKFVVWLFPDFQRFDQSAAVFSTQGMSGKEGLGLLVYGFVFIAGYSLLAAFSYRGREYYPATRCTNHIGDIPHWSIGQRTERSRKQRPRAKAVLAGSNGVGFARRFARIGSEYRLVAHAFRLDRSRSRGNPGLAADGDFHESAVLVLHRKWCPDSGLRHSSLASFRTAGS
jgi:ABC-2 type transport system permease protein